MRALADKRWRRTLLLWLGTLLVLDVLVALTSPGFVHHDEHYQTLELANLKLGGTSPEWLPWEYAAQIRPWLQPGLYYVWTLGLNAVGIHDPFTVVLFLRLGSALIAWLGTACLALSIGVWLQDPLERACALAASTTLAWVPLLHARTSSENLSAAFILAGLAIIAVRVQSDARERPRAVCADDLWVGAASGAAFGVAFLFRYQSAFFALGAWAWCAVIARMRARGLVAFLVAAGALVLLGVLVDRWGYGVWVFTPWRYLHQNLVEGRAAQFGVRPLHGYIGLLWHDIPKPFGGLMILAPVLGLIFCPRHLLVWMSLPFLVGHSALAHKETRFLFPWLLLAPALLAVALSGRLGAWRARRGVVFIAGALFVWNVWLIGMGVFPTMEGAWLERAVELSREDGGAIYYEIPPPATTPGPTLILAPLVPKLYTGTLVYAEAVDATIIERLERGEVPFRYLRGVFGAPAPAAIQTSCAPVALDPPRLAWVPEAQRTSPVVLRLLNIRRPRVLWSCGSPSSAGRSQIVAQ